MKISEERFKSILAGTATNLSSKEILIRQEAFFAERTGQDPMLAIEAKLPDVTIIRKERYRGIATDAATTQAIPVVDPDDLGTAKSRNFWSWLNWDANWLAVWAVVISVLALFAPAVAAPLVGIAGIALFALIAIGIVNVTIRTFGWRPTRSIQVKPNATASHPEPLAAPIIVEASEGSSIHTCSPARPKRKPPSHRSHVSQRLSPNSPQLVAFSERHRIPLDSFFDAPAAGFGDAHHVLGLLNDPRVVGKRLRQKVFLGPYIGACYEPVAAQLAATSERWQVIEDEVSGRSF
ncbi:hypothetical protein [Bradyrhizobium jicamae]|uniref:hypothetical protein n=1 Tax=Bradyrhizobium jicamae TaxID=280332 RepID=UPI0018DBE5EB|nr:hypothetical protein [Bradyrhizobium jicamae]